MTEVAARAEQAVRPRRRFLQRHGATVVTLVLLTLGAIFVLLPLYWLLSTAFKSGNDAFALPPKYITHPTLSAFKTILGGEFAHYVLNSVGIAIGTTLVALVLGVPAGYAFARSPVRGARIFNTWFVLAYVAPPVVFIIPLYIMYQHLHLLDTYLGLILAYETGLLPFTIWLMRVYFAEIPRELDEAAWIDGCSKMRALWKVVLPTVWPGLTTVGLLVGLASWGEYFGALILTGPNTETAPVAVEGYIGTTFANWNELAAAGVVLVVPALLATVIVQRGFVRGLTFGAVKQ
jgi:multiple sugar transport system permease protein